MRKLCCAVVCIMGVVWGSGCSKNSTSPGDCQSGERGIVAIVDGEQISSEALSSAAQSRLARIDTEIYRVKKAVLDDLIDEKLLEQAANKKGKTVESYVAEEIDGRIAAPTEEEMRALFDARRDKDGQTFNDVREELAGYLRENRKAKLRADLLAGLRQQAVVDVKLAPPRVEIDTEGAPTLGSDGAEVILVEFSDYQCPFCRRARPTIWRLLDEYQGKIRYVFMDFPLSFHRYAKKAHEAAHCAGEQGKYFEYNRLLFEHQSNMDEDALEGFARKLNLDAKAFKACLETGKYSDQVERSIVKGVAAGVSGTPAFFINGILLSGAMPYESFKELIDAELKR